MDDMLYRPPAAPERGGRPVRRRLAEGDGADRLVDVGNIESGPEGGGADAEDERAEISSPRSSYP
jgi:hypothetical protein